jgi:hypothetical protein
MTDTPQKKEREISSGASDALEVLGDFGYSMKYERDNFWRESISAIHEGKTNLFMMISPAGKCFLITSYAAWATPSDKFLPKFERICATVNNDFP